MQLLDKTLSAIVDVELSGHLRISQNERNKAVLFILKALLLMPWFFRYPLSTMIVFINLLSLFFKRKMYFKLTIDDRKILWSKLACYPGYSSLKRLVRTLTLLSAYSIYHDQRS